MKKTLVVVCNLRLIPKFIIELDGLILDKFHFLDLATVQKANFS